MASNADFTIDADPFANLGFDAAALQVLALKLEDSPALDVRSTNYRVIAKSLNAGTIVELGDPGSAGASPSPNPQDELDITMPAGKGSWLIQCQINGGKGFVGGKAVPVAEFTKLRIIAVRSTEGLREIVPSENTEYDGTFGWTEALTDLIDAIESAVDGPVSSTDRAIATWNGTDGAALFDNALATINALGNLALGTSPAGSGVLRLPNLAIVTGRNAAADADIPGLEFTAADEVAVGGTNAAGVRLRVGAETVLQALATLLTSSRPLAVDNISGPTAAAGSLRVRNNVDINARNAANDDNLRLIGSNASDDVLVGASTGVSDVIIDAAVQIDIMRAGGLVVRINSAGLNLSFDLLFDRTNATPDIAQTTETVSGVSGRPMAHHAQDTSGTGVKTGGSWSTRGGNASGGTDTGGPWDAQAGSGAALNGVLALRDAAAVIVASITALGEWALSPATQIVTTSQAARAPVVTDIPDGAQTTDATITTAASKTIANGTAAKFTADVSWRSATDGDSGGTTIHGVVEGTVGLTIVGTNTVAHASAEDAGWGTVQGAPVVVDTSGSDLRVRVEGQAADTINWSVHLRVVEHQTT